MLPAPVPQTGGNWLDEAFAVITAWEVAHGGPMLQRTETIALAERIARALESAFKRGRWERTVAAAKFKPGDEVTLPGGQGHVWHVMHVLENLGGEAGYLLSDGRTERTTIESVLRIAANPR